MAQRAKRKRGRPVKHGLSRTRTYNRWRWLDHAHTHKRYSRKRYGYEITLCKEWQGKKGLIQFYKDMGEPPEPAARIKFHDITKPISKDNCYWKTPVVELTAEELQLASYRLKVVIENHKDLLTKWERKLCFDATNYLKGNLHISRSCFLKIKEIYVKTLQISGQAVNSPPTNKIDNSTAPTSDWLQAIRKFEKEQERRTITSPSVKPLPATISNTPPQKTTWDRLVEFEKQLHEKNDTNKPDRGT
jgi:hypothetical protein